VRRQTSFADLCCATRCGAATRSHHDASNVLVGCLVILLLLILATMLGGPIGFIFAAFLILVWAVVSGSLRLLWNLLLLPFRLVDSLIRRR
jgi:hypothetical protein